LGHFFYSGQLILNFVPLFNGKGLELHSTTDGLNFILGDFWIPLGDFLHKKTSGHPGTAIRIIQSLTSLPVHLFRSTL
jgi:hypothetical protein